MILYLPAMSAPLEMTGAGVSMVFVSEIVGEPAWLKGAAQLLQNRDVSLFSEWHLGHRTATFPSCRKKNSITQGGSQRDVTSLAIQVKTWGRKRRTAIRSEAEKGEIQ
ncbi:MAG: hypothetical protein A2Y69_02405 [Candidatus Aminicenantes bacterium RBG_13_59_9]|nr:MAG: hypothetical protein A2Y69_02405 [Candidatus Aminicenantes bacterium RBG_13_59_9]